MNVTQILYVDKAADFRRWLMEHHTTAADVWLLYPSKASGKPRISDNAAVEVALCFGWIDSTVRNHDAESSVQRFSPRRPNSPYSQANSECHRRLRDKNQLLPQVRAQLEPILAREFVFPDDIIAAIQANERAWVHYQGFSPAYRRIRVAFIEGARTRPAEFQKRLRHFIAMTEKNRLFGFGGIDAYFQPPPAMTAPERGQPYPPQPSSVSVARTSPGKIVEGSVSPPWATAISRYPPSPGSVCRSIRRLTRSSSHASAIPARP